MVDSGYWAYSPDHGQLCQIIEAQTLWGETTCRVLLPGSYEDSSKWAKGICEEATTYGMLE